MTPEEKLCSRSWRLKNSLWVLPCILGAGVINWTSYLYIGIKSKRRSWLIWAGVWGAWFILAMFLPTGSKGEESTTAESIAGGALAIAWIAGIIQALVINRQWLKWRAASGTTPWYSSGTAAPPTTAPSLPGVAGAQHMDRTLLNPASPPLPPPYPPPPAVPLPATAAHQSAGTHQATVDINVAGPADLQALLGLPADVSERIVAERSRQGRFTSPDQLLSSGSIPPHLFAQVADRLVAGSSTPGSVSEGTPPTSGGRRLDL